MVCGCALAPFAMAVGFSRVCRGEKVNRKKGGGYKSDADKSRYKFLHRFFQV